MIDILKEGFVGAKVLDGNLQGYLFYLTYNNRSDIYNSKNINQYNLNYKNNNIEYFFRFSNIRNKQSIKSKTKFIELVLSYSAPFHRLMSTVFGVDKWYKLYNKNTLKILEKHLKDYKGFISFTHKLDKTGYRIHQHILIYPYLKNEKTFLGLSLNKHTNLLDKEILNNIKIDYRKFAKDLYNQISDENKKMLLNHINNSPLNKNFLINNIDKKNEDFIISNINNKAINIKNKILNNYKLIQNNNSIEASTLKFNEIIITKKLKSIIKKNNLNNNIDFVLKSVFNNYNNFKLILNNYSFDKIISLFKNKKIKYEKNTYLLLLDFFFLYFYYNKIDKQYLKKYLIELKNISTNENKSIINNTLNSIVLNNDIYYNALNNESIIYNKNITNNLDYVKNDNKNFNIFSDLNSNEDLKVVL